MTRQNGGNFVNPDTMSVYAGDDIVDQEGKEEFLNPPLRSIDTKQRAIGP
jgi:hypothetical protein